MMMPQMIQQAMVGGMRGPGGATPPMAAAPMAVPVTPVAATAGGAAAAAPTTAGGMLDFGDLAPAASDPRALVRSVATSNGWTLAESGDTWQITIPVGTLRKQVVSVDFSRKDDAGHALLAYRSSCGPASESNAMQLLRYNTQLVHGAFAVAPTASGEMIILQANQLADTADPLEITRVLTAIAWQADKVEEKLSGGDVL